MKPPCWLTRALCVMLIISLITSVFFVRLDWNLEKSWTDKQTDRWTDGQTCVNQHSWWLWAWKYIHCGVCHSYFYLLHLHKVSIPCIDQFQCWKGIHKLTHTEYKRRKQRKAACWHIKCTEFLATERGQCFGHILWLRRGPRVSLLLKR